MSVKFNTGVHFRNKDGTWDDSYLTEQVILNKDYKELENKPIQYLSNNVNLNSLNTGTYMVDHNGTNIILTNSSNESVSIPDKSVLFVVKPYQNVVNAIVFINGVFYEINQNTLLETDLDNCKLITVNDINNLTASNDDILDMLYELNVVNPVGATFDDGTNAVLTYEDGAVMTFDI